jgi:plasmid stability protein
MSTIYLRNVPEEVVDRLKRLAAIEGMSVNAVAVRELAEASRRADNPALLGSLPHLGVDTDTIAANLESERAVR